MLWHFPFIIFIILRPFWGSLWKFCYYGEPCDILWVRCLIIDPLIHVKICDSTRYSWRSQFEMLQFFVTTYLLQNYSFYEKFHIFRLSRIKIFTFILNAGIVSKLQKGWILNTCLLRQRRFSHSMPSRCHYHRYFKNNQVYTSKQSAWKATYYAWI